jgi:hypothetical protein
VLDDMPDLHKLMHSLKGMQSYPHITSQSAKLLHFSAIQRNTKTPPEMRRSFGHIKQEDEILQFRLPVFFTC